MKKLFALLNGARSTVELSTSDRVFEENCHRGVIHRIWHAGSLQNCFGNTTQEIETDEEVI